MTGVLLAGALVGTGLFLLVLALEGPATRGAAAPLALARLDADRRRPAVSGAGRVGSGPLGTGPVGGVRLEPLGRAVRRRLEAAGLRLPRGLRADLSLLGRSVDWYLAATLLGGLAGALAGGLLAGGVGLAVPELPTSTPLWMSLLGLLAGGLLPTAQVLSRAAGRRRDFRHVVGSFLDLVALNLSGGRGVPEALGSAAAVSDGWAMVRLRDCLEAARLRGVTPWTALGELGEQTRVAELRDLAAALDLVADDGAKVRESLAARAASLRRRELADAEGRAQARSQSMLIAQLLLAIGFLVFLIYPAITRVLGS